MNPHDFTSQQPKPPLRSHNSIRRILQQPIFQASKKITAEYDRIPRFFLRRIELNHNWEKTVFEGGNVGWRVGADDTFGLGVVLTFPSLEEV